MEVIRLRVLAAELSQPLVVLPQLRQHVVGALEAGRVGGVRGAPGRGSAPARLRCPRAPQLFASSSAEQSLGQ